MIDNLITSNKLFELSNAPTFNIAAPDAEFKQLSQRSMAIQQKFSIELDALNKQYSQ